MRILKNIPECLKNIESIPDYVKFIPSFVCFIDPFDPEPYEWQSWGLVIKHLRDSDDIDQSTFGRLLQGYTRAQISRYETESSQPPIDFWIKLIKYFGLNLNWALTGQGVPFTLDYLDCDERKRHDKWLTLMSEKKDFLRDLKGFDSK